MGVAAQVKAIAGARRVQREFGRMHERDPEALRYCRCRGVGVRRVIVVDVVEPGQVQGVVAAPDRHGFVDEHPDAERLERCRHRRGVVIAEDREDPVARA